MSELRDFIQDFAAEGGALPLIHTTDKFTLKLIRDSKKLEPATDEVYPDEKLVYMFYGRPSFRVNSDVQHTSASFFAPVCLIFDRDLLNEAYRIMPFDTGAHHAGMLKQTIHKKMNKKDFELEVHPNSPLKLIKCFYGSEMSYLENRPHADSLSYEKMQEADKSYVEAYYHLVHHRSNSSLDDRVNAVEVQFNKEITLNGKLRAIIIPSRYFTKDVVSSIEVEFGATAIMYEMPATYKPNELMNTLYEKVRSFIVNRGE